MSSLLKILAAGAPVGPSVPSSYMPNVRVEIAWNAGVGTPSSLYTWTDVTDYVELDRGITITGGRGDERSTADANQLSLTLDNRDGRFTAGLSSSPYYPYVKLSRPIRVILDPVDGTEMVAFTGFVNEWPVEWSDGTDATAYATVSASSRLSRLGLQANLTNIVSLAILADAPVAYYTLGEPSGSTQANDSSGNRADPLTLTGDATLPVVFGTATGPGTDGLTAAQFTTGGVGIVTQYLSNQITVTAAGVTIEGSFLVDAIGTAQFLGGISGSTTLAGVYVDATGHLGAANHAGAGLVSASTFSAGQTHTFALTISGTSWVLYGDGVSVGSGAVTAIPAGLYTLTLGYVAPSPAGVLVAANLGGVLAHVALFNSALTAAQIASHASAGLTGYAGEFTDTRLVRYGAMAGIAAADIVAEAGQATMQHVDTTDKQVVELMRVAESTEGGVLFDRRDGRMEFQNRAHRYTAASVYTLNMAEQEVEMGYAPRYDRIGIANDISAQDISGRYTAHVFDQTSIDDNGQATASVETASQDDDAPLFHASWLLYTYKDPKERAPVLEVDCLAQVGKAPSCAAVLATTVGDKITVSNRPAQASSSTVDYFVEGWTLNVGPESLKMSFNVSPSAPYDQVLVIGDATRGVIGTNVVGF